MALFNVLYIEGNSKWCTKLSSSMIRCHESIEGARSNYLSNENASESFVKCFIRVAESIEKIYNFQSDIETKKQRQKEQMIRDIQERLANIGKPGGNRFTSFSGMGLKDGSSSQFNRVNPFGLVRS